MFDWTINLGHLLTFFGFLACGFGFIYTLRNKVSEMVERLGNVETEVKKMTDVLVQLGRQDERLQAMDRRIDDLQHGRGFVLDGLPRVTRSGE